MHSSRYTTLVALAGLSLGCTTGSVSAWTSREMTEGVSASTVVHSGELVGLSNQGSLMDALERLRPYMLSSRGTTPSVSIDGAPAVELSLLRTIPVRVVRQVRLQRAASGTGRARITHNGDTVVGDVIVVTTWEADRPR